MKRAIIFSVFMFLLLSACFGNEHRIIGTWIDNDGDGWIFGSNGRLTFVNDNDDFEYLFKDDKLIINFPGGVSAVFNVTIDDKTMILEVYSRIGITPFWIHNYSFTKEQEILYGVAPIKFTVCRKCMRTLVRTACAFYIWFN